MFRHLPLTGFIYLVIFLFTPLLTLPQYFGFNDAVVVSNYAKSKARLVVSTEFERVWKDLQRTANKMQRFTIYLFL